MISNQEYCAEHPNCQIGGIYIGNKSPKNQRKLCLECILALKLPVEQILSKKEFLEQLLEKSNTLNIKKALEETQSKSILKPFLNQIDLIEKEIGLIFQSKRDSINKISEDLIQGDIKFLNIIKENLNPFECSQEDLDFLVNFIEGNIFEQWINQKNHVDIAIQKIGKFLEGLTQYLLKASHLVGEIHNLVPFLKNQESKIQLEGFQGSQNQLMKTSFHLITKSNGDKLYQLNGETLRIDKNILGSKNYQVFFNIEQMKYLQFQGQYGINGYKYKYWNYLWKGKEVGGGNFNIMGEKEGKWIDICDNYWDNKQIIEEGQYQGNKRIGDWILSQKNQKIGGGTYEMGLKIGKWVELIGGYSNDFQITQSGEYKNGKKVSQWDIVQNNGKGYQQIGGGQYDVIGDETKTGKWIDINEGFCRDSQVTYTGEYKNGKKVGKWNTWYKSAVQDQQNRQIGGGSYDEIGNEIKIGKWIDIIEEFCDDKQVTFKGEYKNGKKVGEWEIWYREEGFNKLNIKIGIGFYDNDLKVGKWIDIMNEVSIKMVKKLGNGIFLIMMERVFNRLVVDLMMVLVMRQKLGSGLIQVRDFVEIAKQLILENIKMGKKWVNGILGIRIQLDITNRCTFLNRNYKLFRGGGLYDNECCSIKTGMWVDLDQNFNSSKLITHKGEYKNGKRVGVWVEIDIETQKQLKETNFDN